MLRVTLRTKTKLLCNCPVEESLCPYCQGLPGAPALPNGAAVALALRACKAMDCAASEKIVFLRALDQDAPRGYRLAAAVGSGGTLAGRPVAQVALEEGPCGEALLLVDTDAPPEALDALLGGLSLDASPAVFQAREESAWYPIPDQPAILVGADCAESL